MVWPPATIARVLAPLVLLACGGSNKKPAEEPSPPPTVVAPPPAVVETYEDRDKKRHADAIALIPEGSRCLPAELRNVTAPRLQLSAIDGGAVVCALDQDRTRLLGVVACWSVELKDAAQLGALTYTSVAQLPGRGISVILDDRCARSYCLPKDVKVPQDQVAQMAWNLDRSKVAVLAADIVHIFDAAAQAHETSFPIRGDKGVTSEATAIHWNGDAVFVEASDGTTAPVFMFKPDGTPTGPLEAIGKDRAPVSTRNGSFVMLNDQKVAISELGMSSLTIYETDTGRRTKLVRKLPASTCKKDELEAMWRDPAAPLSPKCKDYVAKNYAHLIGADMVAGSKNLLVLLRGPREGELAVLDAKTLAERKTIKMPWCDGPAGGAGPSSGAGTASPAARVAAPAEPAAAAEPAAPAPKKMLSKPARAGKDGAPAKEGLVEDPDSGGQ
jgi:hypothetical protein